MTRRTPRTPCPRRCCGGHTCTLDIGPHLAHERCICADPACACHDAAAYGLERVTVHGAAQYRTLRLLAVAMIAALALALAAFVAGFTLSSALGVRTLRSLRAERTAWQRNYQMEHRRHDITVRRMESREALAAANIVQLSHALHDATAQAQGAHGGPRNRRRLAGTV